jgi:hypothetical protein
MEMGFRAIRALTKSEHCEDVTSRLADCGAGKPVTFHVMLRQVPRATVMAVYNGSSSFNPHTSAGVTVTVQ